MELCFETTGGEKLLLTLSNESEGVDASIGIKLFFKTFQTSSARKKTLMKDFFQQSCSRRKSYFNFRFYFKSES